MAFLTGKYLQIIMGFCQKVEKVEAGMLPFYDSCQNLADKPHN